MLPVLAWRSEGKWASRQVCPNILALTHFKSPEHLLQKVLEQPGFVLGDSPLPFCLYSVRPASWPVLSQVTLYLGMLFCLSRALQWFPAVPPSLAASNSRIWSSGRQMWNMSCVASSTSQVEHHSGCSYPCFSLEFHLPSVSMGLRRREADIRR